MRELIFPQKLELFKKEHKVGFWILLVVGCMISQSQSLRYLGWWDSNLLLNIIRFIFGGMIYFIFLYIFCEVYYEISKIKGSNLGNPFDLRNNGFKKYQHKL